jgi:hypothetical protein
LCYCRSITMRGEVRFENVMGPRLEKLMWYDSSHEQLLTV